ncbi:MAG: GNAT family N-acetyltransferase [Cellulosilyticum sp.]|nr:GNAT family N-acetyltransferase [Cellulosilyticum sp.]
MNRYFLSHLESLVQGLGKDYSLKMIDETLYHECKKYDWSRDFVHGYKDYEMYQKYGLGVVAFYNGEMVAGASSYASYQNGIEIEINTKKEYRRKGLATVCGAKIILECLKRGWYPSWDAQNTWSVSLAEKLGYHYSHTYTAYEVWK